MRSFMVLVLFWSLSAQAAKETIHVQDQTTMEEFSRWLIEAASGQDPVQFEFSNLERSFNPIEIFEGTYSNKSKGDVYFLIGDLTNSWSEEEYVAYFPVAKWLSLNGYRAVINPAVYIRDVRDAVKSETTRGIIWSSHGSEDGEIFDKADKALPKNIFSIDAADSLTHFVLGDCYGEKVAAYYGFPEAAGVHHWTGEITSEDFFKYLKSNEWQDDFKKDMRRSTKKKR